MQAENQALLSLAKGIEQITYGNQDTAFASGHVVSCDPFLTFDWKQQGKIHTVETHLIGSYNLDNVLAAVAIGRYLKVPAERILILTPHCIQRDTCVHKITRNVENCRQCGGCSVGSMLGLAHKYGCKLAVATGGTLARQMVKQARPKAIVAVACERDLTSGIQDVFPLPVLGVLNERPFGPCFNTRVDIDKLEKAILVFMDDEEAKIKNAEAKQASEN